MFQILLNGHAMSGVPAGCNGEPGRTQFVYASRQFITLKDDMLLLLK